GLFAKVDSTNAVPTAAGFASSASGFAALAAAATKAANLDISNVELSKLTRQGSGSACRSIYGGFVEWEKGEKEDGTDSYAKEIASREGMKRTVETSEFYEGWLTGIPADIEEIKAGIKARDFNRVGAVAEANCLKMHATTLGAKPPFTYWTDATMRVMQTVQK